MNLKSISCFYKLRRLIFIACALMLSSFISNTDPFQELIDSITDEKVKKALLEFRKKGIEFSVDTKEYDLNGIVFHAMSYLGTPHQMGGESKKGIDCSGLMMVVHRQYGIKLPHSSHEQARYGKIIPHKEQLEVGDLVFFYDSYQSSNFITHSGLYLGEGIFIHTSNLKGVIKSSLDDAYWSKHYLFATRLRK